VRVVSKLLWKRASSFRNVNLSARVVHKHLRVCKTAQ
jgi:hypothetical protein